MLLLKSAYVSLITDTASIVLFIFTDVHATLHRLPSVCNAGPVSSLAWHCWFRYSNASSTYRSHRKQTRRTCLWKRIVFYLQRFSLELQYKQFIDRLSTDGEFIQSSRRSAGGCVCLYVCMRQSVWQLWQRGKSLDVCAASSSSSSRPSLASTAQWLSPFFPTTYTATKWNHHLWVRHNNKPEHKETRLLWLVRTLLKSFMLVACTGVPINVR